MLRLFKERDEVRIVGDQWGSPTYAPDLAAAILEIVRLNSDAYGMLTSPQNAKFQDLTPKRKQKKGVCAWQQPTSRN